MFNVSITNCETNVNSLLHIKFILIWYCSVSQTPLVKKLDTWTVDADFMKVNNTFLKNSQDLLVSYPKR